MWLVSIFCLIQFPGAGPPATHGAFQVTCLLATTDVPEDADAKAQLSAGLDASSMVDEEGVAASLCIGTLDINVCER